MEFYESNYDSIAKAQVEQLPEPWQTFYERLPSPGKSGKPIEIKGLRVPDEDKYYQIR